MRWYHRAGAALAGASAGIYTEGFLALSRSGFTPGNVLRADWRWPEAFCLILAAMLLVWAGQRLAVFAGTRYLGLERNAAWDWAFACDLPLLLLGFGLCLFPKLLPMGAGLHLSVLGQVRWPWQQTFTLLPAVAYLLLLWAGPWLTLPWFLKLAAGVKAYLGRMARTAGTAAPARVRPGLLFVCGFFFYLVLGVWSTTVYPPTGDEPHYLLMTHSLVHEHDLDLADNMARKDYKLFYPAEQLDFHGLALPGRPWISKHYPLLSFLLVPGYALLGRFGASLTIMLAAAALAWVIYKFALAITASEKMALAAWAIALLSPPLGVYFDLIFTELPASLILLLGIWFWYQGGSRGVWLAALAALILPWFYPKYIPVAALLGLALPWARGAKVRDLVFVGVLALAVAGLYYYVFRHIYGASLAGGHYGEFYPLFSWHSLGNALGLLVDRDSGFFTASPALLLGLIGSFWLTRSQPKISVMILALLAVEYIFYATFSDFTGSIGTFSRNALPGPLLLLALVPLGWKRVEALRPWGRILASGFLAIGVGISWFYAACPALRYLSPKTLLWSKLGWEPYVFPSLFITRTPGTYLWALAWVAAMAGLVWLALRRKA